MQCIKSKYYHFYHWFIVGLSSDNPESQSLSLSVASFSKPQTPSWSPSKCNFSLP